MSPSIPSHESEVSHVYNFTVGAKDVPLEGAKVPLAGISSLLPPNLPKDRILGISDLDGTALVHPRTHVEQFPQDAPGDLGLLLFVADTQKPSFYRWTPEDFARIFLPDEFREALEKVRSSFGNLSGAGDDRKEYEWHGMADYILAGTDDVIALYTELHRRAQDRDRPMGTPDDVTLASAFGRVVTRVDKAILHAQPIFDIHAQGSSLLMRTRTLPGVGEEIERVNLRIEAAVMELLDNKKNFHGAKPFRLHVDQGELSGVGMQGLRTAEKVSRSFDCPSTLFEHPPVLQAFRMIYDFGGRAAWATTNIAPTVEAATKWSAFKFLLEQENPSEVSSISNRLETMDDGTYGHNIADGANYVYGPEKLTRILAMLERMNNGRTPQDSYRHVMAFGDSPSNDWPMMLNALANGGVAMITCSTIADGKKKFGPLMDQISTTLGNGKTIQIPGKAGRADMTIDFSQIPGENLEARINHVRQRLLLAPILREG